jgi:hypothetical protein
VNELVILINSNTTQRLKLCLDDFTGPHLTNFALATRVSETSQAHPAGPFEAELNAAKLAPGLYTCRLTVDGQPLTRHLSIE